MKRIMLVLAVAGLVSVSCGHDSPTKPAVDSRVEVYVFYGNEGLADRKLELLEVGLVTQTDGTGIAEFVVPAGTYTLRAYGITTGGPGRPYLDFTVKTTPSETTRVEVFDCLPCV